MKNPPPAIEQPRQPAAPALAVRIARAAPELAGELTRIALAAKRHWRYPERWIEIWTADLTVTADYVAAHPTYAAFEAGAAAVDRDSSSGGGGSGGDDGPPAGGGHPVGSTAAGGGDTRRGRARGDSAAGSGEPLGFYALVLDPGGAPLARLDHLWLRPDWIGRGLGRALWQHALGTAAALGVRRICLDSEPYAEPFYLHMGARRTGERRSEIEGQSRTLPLLEIDLSPPIGGGGA